MDKWITVYKDGSWIEGNALDAYYYANDPDWLVTIPVSV
jgi:hypothetical protein